MAEVAVSIMAERGHAVVSSASASEALHVLNSGQPFDVILSDLVMPGEMNGFDLAQHVRDRWPTLPVLLATGYSDQAARAIKAGFPLISKPYEPAALLLAVEGTASAVTTPRQIAMSSVCRAPGNDQGRLEPRFWNHSRHVADELTGSPAVYLEHGAVWRLSLSELPDRQRVLQQGLLLLDPFDLLQPLLHQGQDGPPLLLLS